MAQITGYGQPQTAQGFIAAANNITAVKNCRWLFVSHHMRTIKGRMQAYPSSSNLVAHPQFSPLIRIPRLLPCRPPGHRSEYELQTQVVARHWMGAMSKVMNLIDHPGIVHMQHAQDMEGLTCDFDDEYSSV